VKEFFEWKEINDSEEWDRILICVKGHPLQSAKWGNSRRKVDGISDLRWAAFKDGIPVFLARFEERKVLGLIKIAWLPKGPTYSELSYELVLQKEFLQRLRKKKYFVCVTSSYKAIDSKHATKSSLHTIWVDLTIGKQALWENLDKQFRYDAKRSKKEGVVVERTQDPDDIKFFYDLCKSISHVKAFHLNTSLELMVNLLKNSDQCSVESQLFIARFDGKLCAGAFIIRCGESVHYLWGGMNRAYSKQRVGEAVQWAVVEWALEKNCKTYDLEGIDLKNNLGTFNFKKKLGGKIITLTGQKIYPLNRYVSMMTAFLKFTNVSRLLSRLREII
jgi:hypothetical protein